MNRRRNRNKWKNRSRNRRKKRSRYRRNNMSTEGRGGRNRRMSRIIGIEV